MFAWRCPIQLSERVRQQLVRSALLAGGAVVSNEAAAAIIHSGVVNLPIPVNIDGVYVNMVTGATGTSAATVSVFDINPYSSSGLSWFTPSSPAFSHGLVRGLGSALTPEN